MKLRTGEPTEKENITNTVQKALESTSSFMEFSEQIDSQGFEIYFRSGVPYGVTAKRKYRFSSIGVSLDKFFPEIDRKKLQSNQRER